MSTVRDILQFALSGKGRAVARQIALAERIEAAIYIRFAVSVRGWRLKHLRWLFDVYTRDWSPRRKSEGRRLVILMLNVIDRRDLVVLSELRT